MGFYNRDNLKLHELTSPRINCKLPGCLQIPKMLVQAAINGANTSSKLRPLAKPTSLLQEKKKRAAHSSAASFSGDVIPQCDVALSFFRRGFDQKSRLALLPLFLVKWFAHTAQCCYQKTFFLCNSNVKRLYTVYQQPINSDHTNSKFKADPLKVV